MAERGNEERGYLSSGSEFLFDFYCEICKDDGKNIEAEGFCVDCSEYLCGMCYTSHQRTRQTRHHELLNKDEMPKDTPLPSDRLNKDISKKCKVHAGKPVEYYCKTHKTLGCCTCIVTEHRGCSDIESILEKSECILESQEYKDLIKSLTGLDKYSHDTIEKAHANVTKTKGCYSEVLQSIKLLRENVIKALDELEHDIIAEADAIVSKEDKKMEVIINNCNIVTETVATILAEFQGHQSTKRVCQLYISMKERSKQIKTLQDQICKAEKALVIKTFKFEPNQRFATITASPSSIGKISFEGQTRTERQQANANSPALIKTMHVMNYHLPINTNIFFGGISGSATLSDGRLIMVDCNNSRVELSNPQTDDDQTSGLTVSGIPWDVTVISRNKAAVTLSKSKKILLLNLSDIIEPDREIFVEGKCFGVAYSEDKLVVSYHYPPKLEIMDIFGNIEKTIKKDSDGKELFECPQYVCVSTDGDTIYVSDYNADKVTSLTFDGVVKSIYTDDYLVGAQKVCVDNHDNVYVCGFDSINVHMLSADLTKIKIILTEADGLDRGVMSISYCHETHSLYISMWNMVKIFELS